MSGVEARFGAYRLLRLLGRGGMAEVYLAEPWKQPGHRVAIKRVLPHLAENRRFVAMLRDEAHIAAAIRHPNVGAVLDFGSVDGQHYLAMEYIDGVDLGRVLRRLTALKMPCPLDAALYIGYRVALGLHAAHTLVDAGGNPQHVIHRDVSPHNILVSHQGEVKLIDFGVAKARTNSTQTRSGVIKGKLQYMSPEQAQAQTVDPRSDVFALGMTLYKIITGRLPFTGRTDYQIYDQILRRPPPPPRQLRPDLPERVEAIILRALRKPPEGRFQSAAEMAAVLELALRECAPGASYGAAELSALLAHASQSVEATPAPAEIESVEAELVSEVDAPLMADAVVDRLTRVAHFTKVAAPGTAVLPDPAEVLPPTIIGPADPPLVPTQVAEADALVLPPTLAVSVLDGQPVAQGQTAPSRPRPTFQAAATAPRVPLESGALSTPSMHTARMPRRRGSRWLVLGLLGIAAGVALGLIIAAIERPKPTQPPAATPVLRSVKPDVGFVAAVPIDAGLVTPTIVSGTADVSIIDAAVPPPPVLADLRPVKKRRARPKVRRPRPIKRTRAVAQGYVTINALPWAHVEIDGRRLSAHTPIRKQAIDVGAHRITLVAPDGRRWSRQVSVRAGETAKVVHDFRSGAR